MSIYPPACENRALTRCSSHQSTKSDLKDEVAFYNWSFICREFSYQTENPRLYWQPYVLGRQWKGVGDEGFGVASFIENCVRIGKIEAFDAGDMYKLIMYNLDADTADNALQWLQKRGYLEPQERKFLLAHIYTYLKEVLELSGQRSFLERVWIDLKQMEGETVIAYHARFVRNAKRMELLCESEIGSDIQLVQKFVFGLLPHFSEAVQSGKFASHDLDSVCACAAKYEGELWAGCCQ